MKPALTPERLDRALEEAAKVFEVPRREIAGRARALPVSRARQALWHALYRCCQTSFTELAWRFNRDHTTIMFGVDRAGDWAHSDPDYADRVRLIQAAALGVGSMRRAA